MPAYQYIDIIVRVRVPAGSHGEYHAKEKEIAAIFELFPPHESSGFEQKGYQIVYAQYKGFFPASVQKQYDLVNVVSPSRIQILYIRDLIGMLVSQGKIEIPDEATDVEALKIIRERLSKMVGE